MDIFIKSADVELEKLAADATHLDDIDILHSERDGRMVAVAMKNWGGQGTLRHVCWQCGLLFRADIPKLRGVEVAWGGTRIMLHAQCVDGKPNPSIYFNTLAGLQARRSLAKADKMTRSIARAALEGAKKIIS